MSGLEKNKLYLYQKQKKMSKTIYIGDIHGGDVWDEIVAKHDDADNIVFIGEFFHFSFCLLNVEFGI